MLLTFILPTGSFNTSTEHCFDDSTVSGPSESVVVIVAELLCCGIVEIKRNSKVQNTTMAFMLDV